VHVIVEAGDVVAARAAVVASGGRVDASAGQLVSADVSPGELRSLAASGGVSYVRPPYMHAADSVTDEGVADSQASVWQGLGHSGAGVKVAIVDLGFNGYADAQAAGDLPGSLTTVDDCEGDINTATEHGTAVAEIVHAMAPDAQLYLICVGDEVDLANAEQYAISQGVTIVNHSVAWFDTSRGDGNGGPGTPDAIVKDARAHGILWVNAAGNYAESHWGGTLTARYNSGDPFQVFGKLSGQTADVEPVWIPYGESACFAFKWDDWPTTTQDFDLLLYSEFDNVNPVASSVNDQAGETLPPVEEFCYTNTVESDANDQWFYLGVFNYHATDKPRGDLYVLDGFPWFSTAAGSVTEPATSPSAFAAGAICWADHTVEPYSSRGPTIDNRVKPDISGTDSTSSPVYGNWSDDPNCGEGGFTGTSAASPHVAGAAALVEGRHPTWTPDQVQTFLTSSAKDLGSGGKDNTFGAGRLWLPVVLPKITSFAPASGPVGTTVTIHGTALTETEEVSFNGALASPTAVTATSFQAVVPDDATSGKLTVFTADGSGDSTTAFKVTPRVDSLSVDHGLRGDTIEIDGHSFTGATKVAFNNVSAGALGVGYTVDNDDQIHATVPPTATSGKVTVTTLSGVGSSAASYTVILPPTVTSFSPASGPVGSTVTVNGTNLTYADTATLTGSDVGAIQHITNTQIKITVPLTATSGKLQIHNPAGTSPLSANTLKVTPRIDSFTPDHGHPGDTIEIDGHSFTGATKVTFNNVSAGALGVGYTVDNDDQIHATVPPAASGGKITVTTLAGTGSSSSSFTISSASSNPLVEALDHLVASLERSIRPAATDDSQH
jgi:Subtilase family/IPT/TIG domain